MQQVLIDFDRMVDFTAVRFVVGKRAKSQVGFRARADLLCRISFDLTQAFEGCIQSPPGFRGTAKFAERIGRGRVIVAAAEAANRRKLELSPISPKWLMV